MKKMKKSLLTAFIAAATILTSCTSDDVNEEIAIVEQQEEVSTFRLTLSNAINYLNVKMIGSSPLTQTGETFTTSFKATRGTYLSFANMFAQSNDWFFATSGAGIQLWDGTTPRTGDISSEVYVFDAGTEEEEAFLTDFPNTVWTAPKQASPNSGPADDDNTVRNTGRNILNYLSASLAYDMSTREFTLTITKANRESLHNPGYVTPGFLVVHTQNNPLFTEGQPIRGNGLEALAEDGSPANVYGWFTEAGETGAPLRLSSSYSILSPAVAYVHDGEQTPLFTNNAPIAMPNNGLKELAEDGNSEPINNYLNTLENVSSQRSTGPITPGQEITFDIQATPGQRLNFATMFVSSNDWFISNNQAGIELFNEDGTPKDSFVINKNYLYDAGTEEDQPVGLGNGQPMNGNNPVGTDSNSNVRRVSSLDDVQFNKGSISSAAGVTQQFDSRGGYNIINVKVERIGN